MSAAIRCASSEYRYDKYSSATALVPRSSTTESTTATDGCARILIPGVMIS